MNRSDRRAIGRQPLAPRPFEVGLAPAPRLESGEAAEAILVVVEVGTGKVRTAGLLTGPSSLEAVLLKAMCAPAAPCLPARSPALRTVDEALARRLRAALEGTGLPVEVAARAPDLERTLSDLRASFSAGAPAESGRRGQGAPRPSTPASTVPPPPAPSTPAALLAAWEHSLVLRQTTPTDGRPVRVEVAVRLAARDARQVLSILRNSDGLGLSIAPDGGVSFQVMVGPHTAFRLSPLEVRPTAAWLEVWHRQEKVALGVYQGESGQTALRATDLVEELLLARRDIEHRAPVAAGSRTALRQPDPVFLGPESGWPDITDAVIAMLDDAAGGEGWRELPREQANELLSLVEEVWSAVALAEYTGARYAMDRMMVRRDRADLGIRLLIDRLLRTRSGRLGGDPRLVIACRLRGHGHDQVLEVEEYRLHSIAR